MALSSAMSTKGEFWVINWLHQKGEFDKQGIAKACRSKDNLNKAENKYFSVSELLIFKNNPINEANSELLNHLPHHAHEPWHPGGFSPGDKTSVKRKHATGVLRV